MSHDMTPFFFASPQSHRHSTISDPPDPGDVIYADP
jgi:hypothetical protein